MAKEESGGFGVLGILAAGAVAAGVGYYIGSKLKEEEMIEELGPQIIPFEDSDFNNLLPAWEYDD